MMMNETQYGLNTLLRDTFFLPVRFAALEKDTLCVGLARVGAETQQILVRTLQGMTSADLGGPLHSLVIPGHMHPLEMDMLKQFCDDQSLLPLFSSDGS